MENKTSKDATVSPQDVVTVIVRSTGTENIEVLNYELDSYSKDAIGMWNEYWALKVNFKKLADGVIENRNFFVKSATNRAPEEANYIEPVYFSKESAFFQNVASALLKNYKSEKWGPSCYLATDNVMVMNDLGFEGYRTANAFFNDLQVIKVILTTLARFHASSILLKDLKAIHERYPNSFEEIMFAETGAGPRWIANNLKVVKSLGKNYGYDPVKLEAVFKKVHEMIKPSKIHRNVICHGDLWTNNVMLNDQSSELKCLLVDFQIIRYAPLVLDLLHLLYLHSSSDFRSKHQNDLIQHYYKVLKDTIDIHDNADNLEIPTLNEILVAFDDLKLFGVLTALMNTLLGKGIIDECSTIPGASEKYFTGDVLDVILAYMDKNDSYKTRVNDIMNELGSLIQRLPD